MRPRAPLLVATLLLVSLGGAACSTGPTERPRLLEVTGSKRPVPRQGSGGGSGDGSGYGGYGSGGGSGDGSGNVGGDGSGNVGGAGSGDPSAGPGGDDSSQVAVQPSADADAGAGEPIPPCTTLAYCCTTLNAADPDQGFCENTYALANQTQCAALLSFLGC